MTGLHDELPQQLSDTFKTAASEADVPPLPLRNILVRGEALQGVRRRRVATWAAAATAAAVAVVALSVPLAVTLQHGHHASQPPTTQRAAEGASSAAAPLPANHPAPSVPTSPPAVPYVQNGVLHVDGRSIGQGLTRAVASGGTVLVLRSTGFHDGGAETLFTSLVDGQRLVPIPALTSVGLSNHEMPYAPYLSADGTTAVAMSWLSGGGVRMTAWSIPQRRVLGTLDLADTEIGAENIAGIESDGTVVYRNPSDQRAYSWLPGHAPQQLDSADSTAIDRGTLVVGASEMTILHGMPNGISALSPNGSAALTVADDGTTSVRDLRTGHGVRLDLPGPVYGTIGFESATAVLVTIGNKQGGPLVRCSTATGACAQIWSSTKGFSFPRLPGGY